MERREFLLASWDILQKLMSKFWLPAFLTFVGLAVFLFFYQAVLEPELAIATITWLLVGIAVVAVLFFIRNLSLRISEAINDRLSDKTRSVLNFLNRLLNNLSIVVSLFLMYRTWQEDRVLFVLIFVCISLQYWFSRDVQKSESLK